MNKRFKTLLMAGLVTTLTATSVVSSSALSKNKVQSVKTKGAIYLCINGVKYKIPFICNGKPSVDEDNSYIFMSKKEDDVIYEYKIDVMEDQFNLSYLDIKVNGKTYHIDFDN